MKHCRTSSLALGFLVAAAVNACGGSGDDGPKGDTGPAAAPGPAGAGPAGAAGAPGRDAPATVTGPERLQLPGPVFFPGSLASLADGTLFVGAYGTGEIVKFAPGSTRADVIVPQASNPQILVPGMFADAKTSTLWACTVSFGAPGFQAPRGELRSYDLNGKLKKSYLVPHQGEANICEEVTVGPEGRVYITDAFRGEVYVLEGETGTVEPWATSDLLKPNAGNDAPPFGAHGIAFDGGRNLYVNNYNASRLVRIPINGDGTPGTPKEITVTPALVHEEGLIAVDANTLATVDHAGGPQNGRLLLVKLSGDTATATTLRNHLHEPTNVTWTKGSYWVNEAQSEHFLAQTQPDLPFMLQRQAQ